MRIELGGVLGPRAVLPTPPGPAQFLGPDAASFARPPDICQAPHRQPGTGVEVVGWSRRRMSWSKSIQGRPISP